MFKYAQIDDNGNVKGISTHSEEIKSEYLIPINEGTDLTNKMYANGEWIDIPQPKRKTNTNEVTEYEMIKAIYEKLIESGGTK